MSYIDCKVSISLSESDKETLKNEFGRIVNDMPGKSESFLMIGFQDNYDLYFKGKKLDYGAFVEVKLFGRATEDSMQKVTSEIYKLFDDKLNIPAKSVYIKFEEVDTWGWNGYNI